MLWEIFGSESTAIDRSSEGVAQSTVVNLQFIQALDEGLVNLMVLCDGVDVDHFGGVAMEGLIGLCFGFGLVEVVVGWEW